MKCKVGDLRYLIKESLEEQGVKDEKFDEMVKEMDKALDKFTSFLIRQNTSPEEYSEYMKKTNKVLAGLKQINISKVKFLKQNEPENIGIEEPSANFPPSLKGGTGH